MTYKLDIPGFLKYKYAHKGEVSDDYQRVLPDDKIFGEVVTIMRANPPHINHTNMLRELCRKSVFVRVNLGSSNKFNEKNPFKIEIQFQPSKTFVLENCTFETGKATLQPESFTVLDELVAYLVRKEDQRIEIGGHTDNVGKAASNLKLSMDRATAVMEYLISKGISPERLTAKGYGMSEPVEENNTAEGRAQNRRTEVKVLD